MGLLNLKEFRELFQGRILEGAIPIHHQVYSHNSELIFDSCVLSFQAKKNQESLKSFRDKFEYTKRSSKIFLPIFLGGWDNDFIYGKCVTPSTIQRVRNCGEKTDDLYDVNEKVQIVTQFGDGFIYFYNPEDNLLKISKSTLAYGKNIATSEYLSSTEKISSDRKFEPTIYKRVLHITLQRVISLENLILENGEFKDKTLSEPQLNLF